LAKLTVHYPNDLRVRSVFRWRRKFAERFLKTNRSVHPDNIGHMTPIEFIKIVVQFGNGLWV
jgi:hypothetical protein